MNKILNHEHKNIADWLKTVRFRKKFIGGVDEHDVWAKIEQLNEMYDRALSAEHARYNALLAQQRQSSSIKPRTPGPNKIERE